MFVRLPADMFTPAVHMEYSGAKVEPVVDLKIKCMPPFFSGLYYIFLMRGVSILSNIANAGVFIIHGDYCSGIVLGLFVVYALYLQHKFMPETVLAHALRSSAECGVMEPQIWNWLVCVTNSMTTYCSLVAPMRTLLITNLSRWGALVALGTLGLNIHGMADENVQTHLGDQLRQFGKAIVNKNVESADTQITAFKMWSFCHMFAEVLMTTLIAYTVNPLVAVILLLPASFATYWLNRAEWNLHGSWFYFTIKNLSEPLCLISFPQSSVFALPSYTVPSGSMGDVPSQYVNNGNKAVWPMLLAFAIRVCATVGFASGDLVHGFSVMVMGQGTQELGGSSGAIGYRNILIILGAMTIPSHIVILAIMFLRNKWWRDGVVDKRMMIGIRSQATHWVPLVRKLQVVDEAETP